MSKVDHDPVSYDDLQSLTDMLLSTSASPENDEKDKERGPTYPVSYNYDLSMRLTDMLLSTSASPENGEKDKERGPTYPVSYNYDLQSLTDMLLSTSASPHVTTRPFPKRAAKAAPVE